jgi:hypothetical protein
VTYTGAVTSFFLKKSYQISPELFGRFMMDIKQQKSNGSFEGSFVEIGSATLQLELIRDFCKCSKVALRLFLAARRRRTLNMT